MGVLRSARRLTVGFGLAVQFFCAGPLRADVISSTATLPLLDVPYVSSAGLGCFPTAGLCVTDGSVELTSVVSSSFNSTGQDIVADAVYSGQLTTLGDMLLGPVTLSGTIEQEVLGRTFSDETGSWTTDITALTLTGPVSGRTLTVGLDGAETSSGTSSIVSDGSGQFLISSFFDVFVELSLDGTPPLSTTAGPLHLVAAPTPVPAPGGLVVVVPALVGLIAARRRWS